MAQEPATHDHYQILNLPFQTTISKRQLKIAYHKALLKHHPDKASDPTLSTQSQSTSKDGTDATYTIDQITSAYKTLSTPTIRSEYDRSLILDRAKATDREKGTIFHTGLEVVDLEDLIYVESRDGSKEGGKDGDCWYRGCRCGDERGFLVTEKDLEREVEHGEVVVGCRGCSLWMKVLFGVEDGEGEDGET